MPFLDARLDDGRHKVLIIGSGERMEALQGTIEPAGLSVHTVHSKPVYLEILPPVVPKGATLRALVLVERPGDSIE